jgi:hypothetical protein
MNYRPYGTGSDPFGQPMPGQDIPTHVPQRIDRRKWYERKRVILPLGALVLLMIGGFLLGGDPTPESGFTAGATAKASAPAASKAPAAPKVTVVKAAAFADEFDANQVAAEAKYKGKIVRTTAKISNINDGRVALDPGQAELSLTQLSCTDVPDDVVLKLKKGATVTITGKVTGQMIGVITFEDCTVS